MSTPVRSDTAIMAAKNDNDHSPRALTLILPDHMPFYIQMQTEDPPEVLQKETHHDHRRGRSGEMKSEFPRKMVPMSRPDKRPPYPYGILPMALWICPRE